MKSHLPSLFVHCVTLSALTLVGVGCTPKTQTDQKPPQGTQPTTSTQKPDRTSSTSATERPPYSIAQSVDGNWYAYSAFDPNAPRRRIMTLNGQPEFSTDLAGNGDPRAQGFSPDGKLLIYTDLTAASGTALFALHLPPKKPARQLTNVDRGRTTPLPQGMLTWRGHTFSFVDERSGLRYQINADSGVITQIKIN